MSKKGVIVFLFYCLFVFSIMSSFVFAQESDFWDGVIGPFAGGFEQAYESYYPFIDGIIYVIIFVGLAQWALGSRFMGGYGADKKGGKAVVVGIGLVFALSLALWERSAGFNIKSFGPIAMLVMIGVMCFAFYEGLRNALGKDNISNTDAFLWSYILFVLAMQVFNVAKSITSNFTKAKPAVGIINLGALIVVIILLWKGFQKLTGDTSRTAKSVSPITPERLEEYEKPFKEEKKKLILETPYTENKSELEKVIHMLDELDKKIKAVQEDIFEHDKYLNSMAEINNQLTKKGSITAAEAAKKRYGVHEEYSKKKFNHDLANLEKVVKLLKKDIDKAESELKPGNEEIRTNLEELKKRVRGFRSELGKIEAWVNA